VALLGREGGELRERTDVALVVPSADAAHVQEVHLVLVHLLCELVEERVGAVAAPPAAPAPRGFRAPNGRAWDREAIYQG
jgi:hypothetical protein